MVHSMVTFTNSLKDQISNPLPGGLVGDPCRQWSAFLESPSLPVQEPKKSPKPRQGM